MNIELALKKLSSATQYHSAGISDDMYKPLAANEALQSYLKNLPK